MAGTNGNSIEIGQSEQVQYEAIKCNMCDGFRGCFVNYYEVIAFIFTTLFRLFAFYIRWRYRDDSKYPLANKDDTINTFICDNR